MERCLFQAVDIWCPVINVTWHHLNPDCTRCHSNIMFCSNFNSRTKVVKVLEGSWPKLSVLSNVVGQYHEGILALCHYHPSAVMHPWSSAHEYNKVDEGSRRVTSAVHCLTIVLLRYRQALSGVCFAGDILASQHQTNSCDCVLTWRTAPNTDTNWECKHQEVVLLWDHFLPLQKWCWILRRRNWIATTLWEHPIRSFSKFPCSTTNSSASPRWGARRSSKMTASSFLLSLQSKIHQRSTGSTMMSCHLRSASSVCPRPSLILLHQQSAAERCCHASWKKYSLHKERVWQYVWKILLLSLCIYQTYYTWKMKWMDLSSEVRPSNLVICCLVWSAVSGRAVASSNSQGRI